MQSNLQEQNIQNLKYKPKNKIRIVTATSLFDGHDVAINIMRRIIQSTGAEVIHLGHDRSAQEVVNTAIQEDVQSIALTSYQGGHMEYFKYIYDLLNEKGIHDIKIFGGGGGVILLEEIAELEAYGIEKIYSPDDGRIMGLQGMINHLVEKSDFSKKQNVDIDIKKLKIEYQENISRLITIAENNEKFYIEHYSKPIENSKTNIPILGITGTGGTGKSSLLDELIRRFLNLDKSLRIGILSVDPTKRRTGGALLGDRIRMNSILSPRVFMRSLATRQSNLALSKHIGKALDIMKCSDFDIIILETSGIGQSDTEILDYCDTSLYVMTPEFGAATQLEKIDMLDFADIVAINKFDKQGAKDALRDVRKQYLRNQEMWDSKQEDLPIFGTMASRFNDSGVNTLFKYLCKLMGFQNFIDSTAINHYDSTIIPPARIRYLSEITENNLTYDQEVIAKTKIASTLYSIAKSIETIGKEENKLFEVQLTSTGLKYSKDYFNSLSSANKQLIKSLLTLFNDKLNFLNEDSLRMLINWESEKTRYKKDKFEFTVRNKTITIPTKSKSISLIDIPKVCLPKFSDWGDILKWKLQENLPGEFPYTSGIYPFKRVNEDPTRMFAGEGSPERTNKRFHYLSENMPFKRLSTAFDSVTLYGRNPDGRPDIFGKIGNAGVNVCCLDDVKKLYSGFHLTNSSTSVSMTINGPAPILLAYFLNATIDQQCEIYIKENGLEKEVKEKINKIYKGKEGLKPVYNDKLPKTNSGLGLLLLGVSGEDVLDKEVYQQIKAESLNKVRGTIQADILKEDQAQNTCIFSTVFALRLMGDVQEYFIKNNVRNFYSVSISGYHIAEAGANPITQLAFTLANGFTYVEYYLQRNMKIDDFAPNLSFFFSNGIDPEYAVIGRVARRIWSKAMREKYGANERSQKLKYHIQTSGRSLHAQEINFNDIRTTLQALYAIYDNCNSLHTNAYDEAITTPTEESVRRALAIQLIINKELGLSKNENPLQGSFIIEELTDLVEEAVLKEFDRLTERGGVLGAMETMYQRSKIQDESLYYESLKHSGELPIIGVNSFLSSKGSPTIRPKEVIRATHKEKQHQISTLRNQHEFYKHKDNEILNILENAVKNNQNIFDALMVVSKKCTIGQITEKLFQLGGQYRRNM